MTIATQAAMPARPLLVLHAGRRQTIPGALCSLDDLRALTVACSDAYVGSLSMASPADGVIGPWLVPVANDELSGPHGA